MCKNNVRNTTVMSIFVEKIAVYNKSILEGSNKLRNQ